MSEQTRNLPLNHPAIGHITSFPINHFAIAPDDNADLAQPCIVVAKGAGDVRVLPAGQGAAATYYVPDGGRVPVVVRRVYSTDTTATGLIGVY